MNEPFKNDSKYHSSSCSAWRAPIARAATKGRMAIAVNTSMKSPFTIRNYRLENYCRYHRSEQQVTLLWWWSLCHQEVQDESYEDRFCHRFSTATSERWPGNGKPTAQETYMRPGRQMEELMTSCSTLWLLDWREVGGLSKHINDTSRYNGSKSNQAVDGGGIVRHQAPMNFCKAA